MNLQTPIVNSGRSNIRTIYGGESVLPGSLIDAYLSTTYVTESTPAGPVALKIGSVNQALTNLQAVHGVSDQSRPGSAFITAFNPFGLLLPADQNEARHNMLQSIIEKNGWVSYEGFGVGDDHQGWEPEKSFLILGIELRTASDLGLLLQQNAIVYCEASGPAALVVLR